MDLSFLEEYLNNDIVNIFVVIFVIMYSTILLPKLPPQMIYVADNTFFKILILTLIAFMANRNLRVSLLIAIVLLLTLNFTDNNYIQNTIN
jgi:hypothetical protein